MALLSGSSLGLQFPSYNAIVLMTGFCFLLKSDYSYWMEYIIWHLERNIGLFVVMKIGRLRMQMNGKMRIARGLMNNNFPIMRKKKKEKRHLGGDGI